MENKERTYVYNLRTMNRNEMTCSIETSGLLSFEELQELSTVYRSVEVISNFTGEIVYECCHDMNVHMTKEEIVNKRTQIIVKLIRMSGYDE